ncbi:hypothetical protein [Rufibacter roseus]|uniref:GIY-YIG nuclease family protein n=1 Tax=Rufibacter roseus TaxID=1567108 RepID=A0ABW2DMV5_9BACT|nr:hypothetical protein [Rufibacter roseus]
MYKLYVLVSDEEPLIKIGYCGDWKRLKSLISKYEWNLENSYFFIHPDKSAIRKFEKKLLGKFRSFHIPEFYKIKYKVGIPYFSVEGASELRSKCCLPLVLEQIEGFILENRCPTGIEKGIFSPELKEKKKSTIIKNTTPEEVWFNDLYINLQGVIQWLMNSSDNPVYKTDKVSWIGTYQNNERQEHIFIVCNGQSCLFIRQLMQIWLDPKHPYNLIERVIDVGDGNFVLVGNCMGIYNFFQEEGITQGKGWWKRYRSLLGRFTYAINSALNLNPYHINIESEWHLDKLDKSTFRYIKYIKELLGAHY